MESPSPVEAVEKIALQIVNDDENVQLEAVKATRRIIQREDDDSINLIIEVGIMTRCVDFLSHPQNPSLQCEAVRVLRYIAAGTIAQTMAVIRAGTLPLLVSMLRERTYVVLTAEVVKAIGYIAAAGPAPRNAVLEKGALQPLLDLVKPNLSIDTLRDVSWCILKLCDIHGTVPPIWNQLSPAVPTLARLLVHEDSMVSRRSCWAIMELTHYKNTEMTQTLLNADIVPRFTKILLTSKDAYMPKWALCSIANIAAGNKLQRDAVFEAGGVDCVRRYLDNANPDLVVEAARTASNLLLGNANQTQALVDAGVIPQLIRELDKGDDHVRHQAGCAITNFLRDCTTMHMTLLVRHGALKPYLSLLMAQDTETVLTVLIGLESLMHAAAQQGEVVLWAQRIKACGGRDKIMHLRQSEDIRVSNHATTLIEKYFP